MCGVLDWIISKQIMQIVRVQYNSTEDASKRGEEKETQIYKRKLNFTRNDMHVCVWEHRVCAPGDSCLYQY